MHLLLHSALLHEYDEISCNGICAVNNLYFKSCLISSREDAVNKLFCVECMVCFSRYNDSAENHLAPLTDIPHFTEVLDENKYLFVRFQIRQLMFSLLYVFVFQIHFFRLTYKITLNIILDLGEAD